MLHALQPPGFTLCLSGTPGRPTKSSIIAGMSLQRPSTYRWRSRHPRVPDLTQVDGDFLAKLRLISGKVCGDIADPGSVGAALLPLLRVAVGQELSTHGRPELLVGQTDPGQRPRPLMVVMGRMQP